MESHKHIIGVLLMLTWGAASVSSITDCATVTALISSCYTFITYGSPDPFPGSPCCDAMSSLNLIADSPDNRPSVCRCLMGLITTYNPKATAIATLPGFCGVHLGFTIGPNTDCNYHFRQTIDGTQRAIVGEIKDLPSVNPQCVIDTGWDANRDGNFSFFVKLTEGS